MAGKNKEMSVFAYLSTEHLVLLHIFGFLRQICNLLDSTVRYKIRQREQIGKTNLTIDYLNIACAI